MLTFMFWNLGGKDLSDSLIRLVTAYEVDILLLAECALSPNDLCDSLNAQNEGDLFEFAPDNNENQIRKRRRGQVEIFCRFDKTFLVPASGDSRYTIRYLRLPGRKELILAAVHLRSPLHDGEGSERELAIRQFVEEIKQVEFRSGNDRTIIVGDLNVNPFDRIVVTADGLHGVASKAIARRGSRTIRKKIYPFFYNPTWNLLGDRGNTPGGTFHRNKNDVLSYFWHLYDQVLLRPSLLEEWDEDSLTIISGDSKASFLKDGMPDAKNFSDHLPLLFRLRLQGIKS